MTPRARIPLREVAEHIRTTVPAGDWFRPTSKAWAAACHRLFAAGELQRRTIKGSASYEYGPIPEQRDAAQRPRGGSP